MEIKPLIIRSNEVIANFTKESDGEQMAQRLAYARAFGMVWSMLSDEQRQEAIDNSEILGKGN